MNAFLAMTVANTKMILRNRVALFFLLAFPALFIILFGYLFSEGDFQLDVGIVSDESLPMADAISGQMESVDGFNVYRGDREAELAEIEEGDRTVVIVFSQTDEDTPIQAQLYVNQENPTVAQVAASAVEQFLLRAELEMTGQPRMIESEVANVDVESTSFIEFLVPGIVGMSLMMNGILSLSSTFVSFRERGVLRRIKGTPFPIWQFILSRITTQVVIAVAQAAILIGLGILLFDIYVSDSYFSLLVVVALGALVFLSIGFIISAIATNTDVADGAANAVFLPMMFLSGVFFPVEDAPAWLRPITNALPLTYLVGALRDIMLRGASLPDVWLEILVLLVTAAVGMIIAVRFFRWEPRAV